MPSDVVDSIDQFQEALEEDIQGMTEDLGNQMEGSAEEIQKTVEDASDTQPSEIAIASALEGQLSEDMSAVTDQVNQKLSTLFESIDSQMASLEESSNISSEAVAQVTESFEGMKTELAQVQTELSEGAISLSEAQTRLDEASQNLKENVEETFSEEQLGPFQNLITKLSESAETLAEGVGAGGGTVQNVQQAEDFEVSLQQGLQGAEQLGGGGVQDIKAALTGAVSKARTLVGILGGGLMTAALAAIVASLGTAVDLIEDSFDAARELRTELGVGAERMREFREVTRESATELARFGLSPGDTTEVAAELAEMFGSVKTATKLTGRNLDTLVRQSGAISEGFGVGAQEATEIRAEFAEIEKFVGGSAEGAIATAQSLARANEVAPGKVMEDITENVSQLSQFSGNTANSIARAAVEARKFGTSIGSVAEFQEQTLTNITGQIQEIQKANQLIGGQLNSQRLLQASFEGTEATVAEVRKQLEGIDFQSLNFYQQRRLSEALPGFSKEELANISKAQEKLEGIEGNTTAIAEKVASGDVSLQQALSSGNVDRFEEIQQQLNALYFTVAEELSPVLIDLAEDVLPPLITTIDVLAPVLQTAARLLGSFLEISTSIFSLSPGSFFETFGSGVQTLANSFNPILEALGIVGPEFKVLDMNLKSMGETIDNYLLGILGGLASAFDRYVKQEIMEAKAIITLFTSTISSVGESIETFVDDSISQISSFFTEFKQMGWSDLTMFILDAFTGIGDDIVRMILPDWSTIETSISAGLNQVRKYLPSSPAETGPLSDLDQVDIGGELTKTIQPDRMREKTEQSVNAAVEGAGQAEPQVQAQPAQTDVQTVETGGGQQSQVNVSQDSEDTSNVESLLSDILQTQKQLTTALQNGNIAIHLDGRKVNKELTRGVTNIVDG